MAAMSAPCVCLNCGKIKLDTTATATPPVEMCFCPDECATTSPEYDDIVEIESVEEYLYYKKECLPSKNKRFKNRYKRKKRK